MALVRITIKSENARNLFSVVNEYLPPAVRFQEKDVYMRHGKEKGRFCVEGEKNFKDFPMNELYQKIINENSLWMPGDTIRAVFIEPLDPVTREHRPYFDFQPRQMMQRAKQQLNEFYAKSINVDNLELQNVDKEK